MSNDDPKQNSCRLDIECEMHGLGVFYKIIGLIPKGGERNFLKRSGSKVHF